MTTPPLAWASGGPRVLLTDCWLQNAGDAAIAVAMQRIIRRAVPDAVIVHAAYGADAVAGRYDELEIVPPIDQLVGTRWAEGTAEGTEFVAAADVVVSQGGGFLRAGYRPWARIDALERVAALGPLTGLRVRRSPRVRRGVRPGAAAAGCSPPPKTVVVRDSPSRASAIESSRRGRRAAGHRLRPALRFDPGRPPRNPAARDVPAARAVPTDDPVGLGSRTTSSLVRCRPSYPPRRCSTPCSRPPTATSSGRAEFPAGSRATRTTTWSPGTPSRVCRGRCAPGSALASRVISTRRPARWLRRRSRRWCRCASTLRCSPPRPASRPSLAMADGKAPCSMHSAMAHPHRHLTTAPRTLAEAAPRFALAVPGPESCSPGTALLDPAPRRVPRLGHRGCADPTGFLARVSRPGERRAPRWSATRRTVATTRPPARTTVRRSPRRRVRRTAARRRRQGVGGGRWAPAGG